MRRNITEKTHAPDGSKTISQLDREAKAWRDQQPLTTTCSVWGCDWKHEGTAGEGREAFLEHRAKEHPTADRIVVALGEAEDSLSVGAGGPSASPSTDKDSSHEPADDPAAEEGPRSPTPHVGRGDEEQPALAAGSPAATADGTGEPVPGPAPDPVDKAALGELEGVGAAAALSGSPNADQAPDLNDAAEIVRFEHRITAELIAEAIDDPGRAQFWIEQLIGEARRLDVRANALRQIAQGLDVLQTTDQAAA